MIKLPARQIFRYGIVIFGLFLLAACSINPPHGNNMPRQINTALSNSLLANKRVAEKVPQKTPQFINDALTPKLSVALPKPKKAERKFDISVNQVNAADFFKGLVKGTKYNVMIDPKVTGTITLNLNHVTIDEVLEAVRDAYGYQYQKESYGYRIYPRELETQIFSVNYLNMDRKGQSETIVNSGQITQTVENEGTSNQTTTTEDTKPTSSIETSSDVDFWKTLETTLTAIIGDKDGHQVVINAQAGLVVVKAYPDELKRVAKYLDGLQNIMARQVILEAKVLEVELNAQYQSGINWRALGLKQTGFPDESQNNISDEIGQFKNIFALHASAGRSFWTIIRLLNSQGRVNVLSSPRISTINNQKAVIKVGNDQFFVTNVESTAIGTGTDANTSQDIQLTPFFSGISLDVTPQIDKEGTVTLHIHPVISKVKEEFKKFTVSGQEQNLPLAASSVRETDNIVRAKNGQVVVIGGLMENGTEDYGASVPGMDKAPGVKDLFQSVNNASRKFELIILLRPIVVEPGQSSNIWNGRILKAQKMVNSMPNDFRYVPDFKPKNKSK